MVMTRDGLTRLLDARLREKGLLSVEQDAWDNRELRWLKLAEEKVEELLTRVEGRETYALKMALSLLRRLRVMDCEKAAISEPFTRYKAAERLLYASECYERLAQRTGRESAKQMRDVMRLLGQLIFGDGKPLDELVEAFTKSIAARDVELEGAA